MATGAGRQLAALPRPQFLPFFRVVRSLDGASFKADLVAGLNVALLAFPMSMAFAMKAGLPIWCGLVGCGVAAATSRHSACKVAVKGSRRRLTRRDTHSAATRPKTAKTAATAASAHAIGYIARATTMVRPMPSHSPIRAANVAPTSAHDPATASSRPNVNAGCRTARISPSAATANPTAIHFFMPTPCPIPGEGTAARMLPALPREASGTSAFAPRGRAAPPYS